MSGERKGSQLRLESCRILQGIGPPDYKVYQLKQISDSHSRTIDFAQDLPGRGPRNPPKKAVNAKYAKACACVFGVLFSEIIARTVLR
jgi:hypothetical protein